MVGKLGTYRLVLICLLVFVPQVIKAETTESDSILYCQKVNRFWSIFRPFKGFRGEIYLKEQEVVFKSKNRKGNGSFTLDYDDIISVKRRCLLIFPNAIVIIDKNFAEYKLGTYKRKRIVNTIKNKIG